MTVDLTGFKLKMGKLRARLPVMEKTILARVALFGERVMKQEAPIRKGRLRTSIEALVQGKRASVGTSVSYALGVARGNKPHRIEPKTKQALFFPGARHPVRGVDHPGNKANPFDLRALAKTKASASSIANAVLRELTTDLR